MTHLFNLYSLSKILLTKVTVRFCIGMYWNTVIDLLKNIALQTKRQERASTRSDLP